MCHVLHTRESLLLLVSEGCLWRGVCMSMYLFHVCVCVCVCVFVCVKRTYTCRHTQTHTTHICTRIHWVCFVVYKCVCVCVCVSVPQPVHSAHIWCLCCRAIELQVLSCILSFQMLSGRLFHMAAAIFPKISIR